MIAGIFFSLKGRIGRMTFWIAQITATIVSLIAGKIAPAPTAEQIQLHEVTAAQMLPNLVLMLALCWVGFAINAKRAHDLGHSAWWGVMPLTGMIVLSVALYGSAVAGLDRSTLGVMALAILLAICALGLWALWIIIQMMFFSGEPGQNDFGDPPRLAQTFFNSFEDEDQSGAEQPVQPAKSAAPQAPVVRQKTVQSPRPSGFGRRGYPA